MPGPDPADLASHDIASHDIASHDIASHDIATQGYLVRRGALDPGPLAAEIDAALADGLPGSFSADVGDGISGRYLPLMNERTPISLGLLDRFAVTATSLLGRPVLPLRAKCVLYFGEAGWHRDSELDVPSLGFAAYLEPLDETNGALRVRPGSHRTHAGDDFDDDHRDGIALHTQPGDVIVFDEHLWHSSRHGRDRRQWRVDYVIDPVTAREEDAVRAYYAGTYAPDWVGGYDVDRFPTYGPHWLASGRPSVERLRDLGVYDLAAAEEAFARSRRA
jgi:hypothetical protein